MGFPKLTQELIGALQDHRELTILPGSIGDPGTGLVGIVVWTAKFIHGLTAFLCLPVGERIVKPAPHYTRPAMATASSAKRRSQSAKNDSSENSRESSIHSDDSSS